MNDDFNSFFDKTDKTTNKIVSMAKIFIILWFTVIVAIIAALGYVAFHFLDKYW